ncbi:glycogen debranching protein GlgX [Citricoccus muralis]|uniref:Glycogen debranching protein GlgX n=1 Tax=Citricoccus muralis TaxID=169134 RepID=A0ABY8H7T3_9MICC|nr:glycogen debranching protein GlgX [Citricoccus muralis]WFP17212.1 glycogen debranching protein GlgX [Citricoccus muralis]
MTEPQHPSRPTPLGASAASGTHHREPEVAAESCQCVNLAVYAPGLTEVDVVFTTSDFPRDAAPTVADLHRVELPGFNHGVHHGTLTGLDNGSLYAFIPRDQDLEPTGPVVGGLLDPCGDAVETREGIHWSTRVERSFDWGGVTAPDTALRDTIIYEAHVIGQTKLHPEIPEHLRGTYAGLAHPVMIAYLQRLGITAVELLPVHHHADESHLSELGLENYWGYNTLSFFSPHPSYATVDAQRRGPQAVADEFKGMVRLLHEAGIEVILDVVYNHTAEEGPTGPTYSWRGLGERAYYRHVDDSPDSDYLDTTGCGNTLNFADATVVRMALDSLRRWVEEFGVDGFRFDLAVSLGRDAHHHFTPQHPFLVAVTSDPVLSQVKLISEPWDVSVGGWQTGRFPPGFRDWNDHFRDTVRDFWVTSRAALDHGDRPSPLGGLADVLSGSQGLFAPSGRSALSSVNYVTAHDGFTLRDLVSYNHKHNEANGEDNRDGTENNRSYNHGAEGPTDETHVEQSRQRTMRNVMVTLLMSLGVPMITAGDELGRSQSGNNNAYCQNNELSWTDWPRLLENPAAQTMHALTRRMIRLRRAFLADQPYTYPSRDSGHMMWFNADGEPMTQQEWESPSVRVLQQLIGIPGGRTSGLVIFNGGLDADVVRVPGSKPGAENLLGDLAGGELVLALSTHGERDRVGSTVGAGDVLAIPGYSISIYALSQ